MFTNERKPYLPRHPGMEVQQRLAAARTAAPNRDGRVLVVGHSMNVTGRHHLTRQTPGATSVEAVDLKDLYPRGNSKPQQVGEYPTESFASGQRRGDNKAGACPPRARLTYICHASVNSTPSAALGATLSDSSIRPT